MEVGIDLIKIARFTNRTNEFCKRILSPSEIALSEKFVEPKLSEFLAGRFAVKEAFFKATQNNISFARISYINGKIALDGKEMSEFKVSISHSQDAVVAIVIKLV